MLRVILLDDEPSARRGLRRLLSQHPEVVIVGEAGCLAEARGLIAAEQPDAVFLDIELSTGKGFEIIKGLPPETDVIVVTAHDLYAIESFHIDAVDFLLKPIEPLRLAVTIDRLLKRRSIVGQNDGKAALSGDQAIAPHVKVLLNTPGASTIVDSGAISMLVAERDYTRVFLPPDQDYLIASLLRKFQNMLPSPPFIRLNRSLIINIDRIQFVNWESGGRCEISFGEEPQVVKIGRSATRRLREAIS